MKRHLIWYVIAYSEVTPVTDHADADGRRSDEPPNAPGDEGATIEAYETDDGVVLYDADNPLAWVQSTAPVSLDERR